MDTEAEQKLDALGWSVWTDMQRRVPGTYTERDRQMFFVGFGYGRLHVLTTNEEPRPPGS